jgi:hypothetical protein
MKQQLPETAAIYAFPGSKQAVPLANPERQSIDTEPPGSMLRYLWLVPLSGIVAVIGLLMSGARGWCVLVVAIAIGVTAGVFLGSWFWLAPLILPVLAGWAAALCTR